MQSQALTIIRSWRMTMSIGQRLGRSTQVLGLGVVAMLLNSTPATAVQFKKLLQIGQTVPGNNQPLLEIVEPAIEGSRQVAVLLKTKEVGGSNSKFQGIYAVSPQGQLSLVEGGTTATNGGTLTTYEFTAPSLSSGNLAYLVKKRVGQINTTNTFTQTVNLRIGAVGKVKTVLPLDVRQTIADLPIVALANNKAYLLADLGLASNGTVSEVKGALGVVNITAATPVFTLLRTTLSQGIRVVVKNTAMRASSKSLLLKVNTAPARPAAIPSYPSYRIFESNGDQNFQPVWNGERRESCGFSVSQTSIVDCELPGPGRPGNFIHVRFPESTVYKTIVSSGNYVPPGNPNVDEPGTTQTFSNPSISDRTIIFRAQASNGIERIYISKNGALPTALLTSGTKLDGKTISALTLSGNGRAIAGNSLVFTATFTDSSKALYRVDL
jgi:hypothetical protein